jgi:hypothetical protein
MGAEVLCSSWRDTFGTRDPQWIAYHYRQHCLASAPAVQMRRAWQMAGIYRHIAQRSTEVKARSEAMRLAVSWARRAEAMDPRGSRLFREVSR